jgi:hypothetical protein
MLTACFDGAGKIEDPKTPVIVVAGFSSIAGVWPEFDSQWSAVLAEFGVTHFHPRAFAYSIPPFERFKNDEPARRALVSRLLEVITSCGLRKFGAIIKKSDFTKGKAHLGFSADSTVDPYVLCSRSTVNDLHAFAKGEGADKTIITVFEKGDSEDLLKKHFDKHGLPEPEFAWSKEVYKKGKLQRIFIGLQAAGWITWEYYVDFCRVSGLNDNRPTEKGRAAFRAFEDMPGNIKIPFASNLLGDILKQSSNSFGESQKVVHDATKRLEEIRRKP